MNSNNNQSNRPQIEILKKDESYAWCGCGKSSDQLWCDGSHKGSEISPKVFKVKSDEKVALCMCKKTNTPPYCDGSHQEG